MNLRQPFNARQNLSESKRSRLSEQPLPSDTALSKFAQENQLLHASIEHKHALIQSLQSSLASLEKQNQRLKEQARQDKSRFRCEERVRQDSQRRQIQLYKTLLQQKQQVVKRMQNEQRCCQSKELQRLHSIIDQNQRQTLQLISTVDSKDQQIYRLREERQNLESQVQSLLKKNGDLQSELLEKEGMGIELLGEYNRKCKQLQQESNNVREIIQVYQLAKQEIVHLKRRSDFR